MKRCNTREMGNKRHMTLLQISRRLCYSFIFREEGGKFVSISLSLSLSLSLSATPCGLDHGWKALYGELKNSSLEGQSTSCICELILYYLYTRSLSDALSDGVVLNCSVRDLRFWWRIVIKKWLLKQPVCVCVCVCESTAAKLLTNQSLLQNGKIHT